MAEFGFETAPGISELEREAVSMRRGSALQQALQATQAADGFFTPERALMAGPGALRVGIEAEKARRDLLVNRAGQGISLAGAAISQRGVQKTHDSRIRQEEALRNYVTRTQGMTQEEAVADMTGEEAALPLVADFALRTRNDLDITKLGARQRAETGRRMDIADEARPPKEEEVRNARVEFQLGLKQKEAALQKMLDTDPSDYLTFAKTSHSLGLDPAVSDAVFDAFSENPEKSRRSLDGLRDLVGVVDQVASLDSTFKVEQFNDILSEAFNDVAENGGELSRPMARAIAGMRAELNTHKSKKEAEAAELDLKSKQALMGSRQALTDSRNAKLSLTGPALDSAIKDQKQYVAALSKIRVVEVPKTPEEIAADGAEKGTMKEIFAPAADDAFLEARNLLIALQSKQMQEIRKKHLGTQAAPEVPQASPEVPQAAPDAPQAPPEDVGATDVDVTFKEVDETQ